MLKNSSIISAKWSNLIFVRLRPLDDEANRRREDDYNDLTLKRFPVTIVTVEIWGT